MSNKIHITLLLITGFIFEFSQMYFFLMSNHFKIKYTDPLIVFYNLKYHIRYTEAKDDNKKLIVCSLS